MARYFSQFSIYNGKKKLIKRSKPHKLDSPGNITSI
jgi:hypothetical protein